MSRQLLILTVVSALSATACNSSKEAPNPDRALCEQVRTKLATLRVPEVDEVSEEVERRMDKHRALSENALGDEFIEKCVSQRTRTWAACVLKAPDSQAASQCTVTSE